MDSGKIDSFCSKIENMAKSISTQEIGLSNDVATASMPILLVIYKGALELFSKDEECNAILERLYDAAQENDMQSVFSATTEEDLKTLGLFAEQYRDRGELKEAAQLFQFLTLLCPGGAPHPYSYINLAETLATINLDAGLQMFDFITNIFPDNPALLISAARYYYEGERPKRALRSLTHAKEICEHNLKANPDLQEFIDAANTEIARIQKSLKD